MRKIFLFVLIVVSGIIMAGCINRGTSTTEVSKEELYAKLENTTTFGVLWNLELLNSTTREILATSKGKAVIYPNLVLSYRESKGENWISKSVITWENNEGSLIFVMTMDNETRKFEDSKEFNVTMARKMAFPGGEIELLLLNNMEFNSTKVEVKCDGECVLRIIKEDSEILYDIQGAWKIEYIEGNVTFDPNTKELSKVEIVMGTSQGFVEKIRYEFVKNNLNEIKAEIERIREELKNTS
ncbi:MAG: hypothetical protein PWP39_883 [Pyrococcus sp.]|uniref:hypothetical protein n=1 Tax=Pyrococcus sp. TaxID=33866 RepID=UPI00259102B0|nr:hypothetical protein [Pyrococcus sp.]MDK2869648.1 hypothetical protein [Pyrococcus sp.]